MAVGWREKWRPLPGSRLSGGQGDSFLAEADDDSGRRVFIKQLRDFKSPKARKRFRREVTAYETLDHSGLPTLIEHNSDQWEERTVPLYLVLDCVDGEDLGKWMRRNGPMSIEHAVACVGRIIDVVDYCHGENVLHRDIKPGNVMLRQSDPTDSVLVDFGLSFTKTPEELGDVTRFGEEIGNRFLRLPEAWSNRTPVSDVTQVAGIFLYALTGIEPHALQDQNGNMPHRRDAESARLKALGLDATRLARLLFLFDNAFETVASARFQSAADLGAAIAHVVSPVPDSEELEGLRAQADELIARNASPRAEASAARLADFTHAAWHVVGGLAEEKGLDTLRQDYVYEPGSIDLALKSVAAPKAPPYVEYRFHERGSTAVVLAVKGEEIWTGSDPDDPAFATAIERQALTAFVAHYGES